MAYYRKSPARRRTTRSVRGSYAGRTYRPKRVRRSATRSRSRSNSGVRGGTIRIVVEQAGPSSAGAPLGKKLAVTPAKRSKF